MLVKYSGLVYVTAHFFCNGLKYNGLVTVQMLAVYVMFLVYVMLLVLLF